MWVKLICKLTIVQSIGVRFLIRTKLSCRVSTHSVWCFACIVTPFTTKHSLLLLTRYSRMWSYKQVSCDFTRHPRKGLLSQSIIDIQLTQEEPANCIWFNKSKSKSIANPAQGWGGPRLRFFIILCMKLLGGFGWRGKVVNREALNLKITGPAISWEHSSYVSWELYVLYVQGLMWVMLHAGNSLQEGLELDLG